MSNHIVGYTIAEKELLLDELKRNPNYYRHLSTELRADKDVVLAAVSKNGYIYRELSTKLRADKDVVLATLSKEGHLFTEISTELRADKDVVLAAVSNYSYCLQYVSDGFKADKYVVLAAVKNSYSCFRFASEDLKADKNFVLELVYNYYKQSEYASDLIEYASEDLKIDRDVVLAVVSKDPYYFVSVSDKFNSDKEIILAAIPHDANHRYFRLASEDLRADKEFVMKLALQSCYIVNHASEDIKTDTEFLLKLIANDNFVIWYAKKIFNEKQEYIKNLKEGYSSIKYLLYYSSIKYQNKTILSKLNTHGIYPSAKFKNLISSFLGLNNVIEFTDKPYYTISSVIGQSDGEFWIYAKKAIPKCLI